ncbi:HWE histidine kinase domain-containing protein [Aurantimonas endophytica]|uniref:histidine kinase n=1 Tax=Aurantimonas endophytica TaxID=1522175 RepID=A0A7W6HCT4_9HYPH|nr:HWE histidine kinase domain-containing protein [Aurantimonas endophytica]MBB4002798.1 light-regulated signal transduction histidine kinase (bacteriophytochrome) [Aurantimonas endophytica]
MSHSDDPTQFAVDLTNCDREPIHQLGRIQGFGFLVAASMDWLIQHVSANVGAFVDGSPDTLLGEPLDALLPASAMHAIRGRLQLLTHNEGSERLFGFDLLGTGRLFDVAVHVSGHSIVIEAEPSAEGPSTNPGTLVKSLIARIQRTDDLSGLFRESVRQLRAVTGFDRVMLYRFADDNSGEVVAESARSGLESFLGLHYPATDIPKQARALYVRNQIRIIADVLAEPVPIEPGLDPNGEALDLSLSLLRAVSPIHIEYLKNMGVSASFSISIVIDGRLWGLFALHHYSARHLAMELRSTTELFGQMISLIIEARLQKEQRRAEEKVRDLHDRFVGKIVSATPSVEALADFADDLRQIVPCDGFAVYAKGTARSFGHCPLPDDMPALARFLNRAAASRIYATDELAAVHPPAENYADRVAGVLAIPISRSPRDYLLFFRKELVQTIHWAGDPASKIGAFGPNGPRLSPRKSFEAWQETVRGKSQAFTEAEHKAAETLRVSILEVLLRFNEETERRQSLAAQRQELLIAELNHRVRNILSLIRALIVQSRPGVRSVDEFAAIIGGRIQALARAHDQITKQNFAAQDLSEIIQTEVQAYIGNKAGRVRLEGPDIHVEARAFSTLALVFHEMVTNSAKYGALSDSSGSVTVAWHIDADDMCRIDWRETGGPPVAPPSRRGFGSTIIERSIPHDLGGEAEVSYHLSGLSARFGLPASHYQLRDGASQRPLIGEAPQTAATMTETGSLHGLSALIVEDNMIIALDAEQILLDAGLAKVFTAASVADALAIIDAEAVDMAMLDVNLGSETSFALVGPLNRKNIPFIFVTGYGEALDLPADAGAVESIKKPFADHQMLAALARAKGGKSAAV